MRIVQRLRDVGDQSCANLWWYSAVRARFADQPSEGRSVHPLHRNEKRAFELPELVDVTDVPMVELNGETRFIEKHLNEPGFVSDVRKDPFDREKSRDTRSQGLTAEKHLSHSARRDSTKDFESTVGAECW
jgi:hypothetical protein